MLAAAAARAWAAPVKRIGVFIEGSEEQGLEIAASLAKALRAHGWREGVNLEMALVALGGKPTPAAAAALVRSGVDVLFTAATAPTRLLNQATPTIPIVTIASDPVGNGFAKSLAQPGGNITGLAFHLRGVHMKSLELARALMPRLSLLRIIAAETDPEPN